MNDYIFDAGRVEELQMTSSTAELEKMFERAKSTIVNGEKVLLSRTELNGATYVFDEISTLEDLAVYKKQVFRYL